MNKYEEAQKIDSLFEVESGLDTRLFELAGYPLIEDIVEELFGEIQDEHDQIDHIEKVISKNKYEFSTRLEVDYINQNYQLGIAENELYETLGGWIVFNTAEIPDKNEIITIDNYRVTILEASSTKIEKIFLELNYDN